jgi:hypothetical protein
LRREKANEIVRNLVAGAELNAGRRWERRVGSGNFNGHYEVADFLIDSGANVNQADAQRFTPLFWAVDRRNMEHGLNGFPWATTVDPLPLIKKLLDAGANPNAIVNNTPRARNRGASPRIVFASSLMRAAFAGDVETAKLLLAYGADPNVVSSDLESMLKRRRTSLIPGYQGKQSRVLSPNCGGTWTRRELGGRLWNYPADGRSQPRRYSSR